MPDLDLLLSRVPFTTAAALRCGWSEKEVARLVRRGEWVRLRHGVLLAAEVHASLSPEEHHRALAVAHQLRLARPAAASHRSAAVLLGLPLLQRPRQVHLTSESARARSRDDLRVWQARLPTEHLEHDPKGVLVTAPARTVIDIARTRSRGEALVVADAALHARQCDREALERALAYVQGWPGAPAAARVCGLADGRSESPGETLTRLDLLSLGHVDLEPQAQVQGASGRWYRVDFLLRRLRLVLEFDGRVKYEGHGGAAALAAEKKREDDLRLAGYAFLRRVWEDLGAQDRLRWAIEQAVGAAQLPVVGVR